MRDDKFIAQKEHWVSELSKHWSYVGPLNEDPLENLWLLMNGRNMWMGRLDLESCLYEKKVHWWQNTDVYPVSWQKCDYVDCIDSCQSLGHSVFEHGSEVGIFFPGGVQGGRGVDGGDCLFHSDKKDTVSTEITISTGSPFGWGRKPEWPVLLAVIWASLHGSLVAVRFHMQKEPEILVSTNCWSPKDWCD